MPTNSELIESLKKRILEYENAEKQHWANLNFAAGAKAECELMLEQLSKPNLSVLEKIESDSVAEQESNCTSMADSGA